VALDINVIKQQAGRTLKSFSPQQLTMVVLLGVIALVGGMTFLRWVSAPSYAVLFSGLPAEEASSVVEELDAQGVPYRLENAGTSILVPQSKVHATRLSLSASGLPKGGTTGYELLDDQGFTTSEFRQRIDYQRAVEGELARTLMAIEGVEAASVRLAIPEESLFSDEDKAARASILLRTTSDLGDEQVQSIVNLVSGAVPDLAPDNVTVADNKGHVLSAPGGAGGGLDNRQLKLAREFERQRAAEAETMLTQVYGPGHAVVRVSAQLNFDESSQETERYNPASQVPLSEETSSETFTGTGNPPGGVVGVDGGAVDGSTQSDYEKTEAARQFGVDRTVTRQQNAPGRVERLSVAVVLDGSVKPVPDPGQVEGLIGAAIGLDAERGDSIVVDTVAFDASLAAAADDAQAAASGAKSRQNMMDLAQTAVGVLVLLLVAFFLWRAMRSTSTAVELPVDGPGSLAAALAAAQGSAGALASAGTAYARRTDDMAPAEGRALVPALVGASEASDVLSLIDQQPDEVATLLRSWLADRRS
jgi:flagellar M-ring protein FliF